MVKRMLVDATHPEETRVVVVSGTKLDEFDFETSTKKQLKGNIYLAKVIRIEPSLQAAFVEYGGNRHGFLAFGEIHPDYYQIPVADREAILAEQERRARQAEENEGQERSGRRRGRNERGRGRHGERGGRRSDTAGDTQPPVLGDADATDALVNPEQAGSLDDQPIVANWDHEAAQSGNYRQATDGEATTTADVAGDNGNGDTTDDAGDRQNPPDEEFEERETLNPNGDFRDAEPGWRDAQDQSGEEDAARDVAEDAAEESTRDSDVEPPSYSTERQSWPATYGELTEVSEARAAEVSASADQTVEGPTDIDSTLAPSSGDDDSAAASAEGVEGVTADGVAEVGGIVETLGGEDLGEEERPRRAPVLRNYKIQEVIKRRQILLVQVVKEERGNKGAALTTYLSLAGRYCVLMPNAGRGGGISRKITNAADRKRMREMLSELEVPQGMGVILRTAGLERSKPEIKRDYDYLIRLWDNIREITLKSTAPALIYEEGNLIKRSIRDLYGKDIEELLIEGEEAYRHAKEFMRQLMPSHAKKVQLYRDPIPLFHRYQVETQLDAMHSPVVQLKSGAYIVINPTEALVAIDVNSGRSTKERNIEEMALRTNVEAAEEIARQLRLRDLAGLIVIDFIDMEDQRHQAQVERRLKEAMRTDRARIQIGRISAFGLLELSRQRLRPSLLETSTEVCPHCEGTGRVRSVESTVLHVLRAIEEEGIRRRAAEIRVTVPTHVALYLLNQKRAGLGEIEQRYGFRVLVDGDDRLIPPNFNLERSRSRPADSLPLVSPLATAAYDEPDQADDEFVDDDLVSDDAEDMVQAGDGAGEAGSDTAGESAGDNAGDNGGRRRRRRRRRRRGDENDMAAGEGTGSGDEPVYQEPRAADDGSTHAAVTAEAPEDDSDEDGAAAGDGDDASAEGGELNADGQPRRRRRGRRGGRRRRQGDRPEGAERRDDARAADGASVFNGQTAIRDDRASASPDQPSHNGVAPNDHDIVESAPAADPVAEPGNEVGQTGYAHQSASVTEQRTKDSSADAVESNEASGPPRRGWWQRLTSGS